MDADTARHAPAQLDALLTPEDVARHLAVSPETLLAWRCTGRQLLPYVKVGRLVRYRPSDVRTFVADHLQAA